MYDWKRGSCCLKSSVVNFALQSISEVGQMGMASRHLGFEASVAYVIIYILISEERLYHV
jgi:hypothetical protein